MSITRDANGVTIETSTNTYTFSYARKVGLPNYGNEEATLFAQVVIEPGDGLGEVETKLLETAAFVKDFVYKQLGLPSTVVASGIVAEGNASAAPKAQGTASSPSVTSDDKTAMWQHLIEHPDAWFDNRATKKGNQPEFKAKRGNPYEGSGLWVNSAPPFAELWLHGEATAA